MHTDKKLAIENLERREVFAGMLSGVESLTELESQDKMTNFEVQDLMSRAYFDAERNETRTSLENQRKDLTKNLMATVAHAAAVDQVFAENQIILGPIIGT